MYPNKSLVKLLLFKDGGGIYSQTKYITKEDSIALMQSQQR